MQTTRNMTFYPWACNVRLQVLSCYVKTRFQRIIKSFFLKSWFECCFWSAHCIETNSRTSDNVKRWVFTPLNTQWWSFSNKLVYCNILRSIKAAFLELEKAMFTSATLVPMFTIITPGPYTQSKQSRAFHAKCNLKVNCDKKWVWQPKLIVWVLQISIRQTDI